jgi:hypothetical protein
MREWWSKLRGLVRRDRLDADLREEMAAHLEMEVEDRIERGLSPPEARDQARRRFGNQTLIQESSREAWMFRSVETLLHDIRYGFRLLRRAPGFAVTAVSTIALGIAATTAAFTLLDYVLLRPLPFAEPDRLVSLYETQHSVGIPRTSTSPPNFADWRAMAGSFDSMGAQMAILFPVNVSGRTEPLRLDSAFVNADLLRTLGVPAAAGRLFTQDDDRVGAPNVIVLSHGVAAALFGGIKLPSDKRSRWTINRTPSWASCRPPSRFRRATRNSGGRCGSRRR